MIQPWKKTMASIALSAALLTMATPVWASDAATQTISKSPIANYSLTDSITAEIKSIINEQTGEGTRLGAVVRLTNSSSKITRVPDYELRLRTADGIEYSLQPSVKNAKSLQPKATLELSYMSVIDRTDDISLTEINWLDVDMYVYPKKETYVLSVPVNANTAWNGSDTVITDQTAIKKWGEAFTIPSLNSPLVYKTVDIHQDTTDKGSVTTVQLEASNPTDERQTVPGFTLDGITEHGVYSGQRAESKVTLEPGEKKYVHILIPTELDSELTSLHLLTPEKFATASDEKAYEVGRLKILLPSSGNTGLATVPKYELGKPMVLDPLNKKIHASMDVSLVELHMSENDGDGFKTALAKFKLTNHSDRPLQVPVFQTKLTSQDGYQYNGSKQATTTARVVPNAAAVVSFSFALPASETGEGLKLSLYDQQTIDNNSFKSILAAYQVNVQSDGDANLLQVYPYDAKVTYWTISANYSPQAGYSYKLKLSLDIKQDKAVLTDGNNSKLEFDAYDSLGRLLGSSTKGFTGQNRLLSGSNEIDLNALSNQLEFPLTIKAYEVITNENGETAKRYLASFKQ
jgi:hypothetical protein